jgi:hypothetical protein
MVPEEDSRGSRWQRLRAVPLPRGVARRVHALHEFRRLRSEVAVRPWRADNGYRPGSRFPRLMCFSSGRRPNWHEAGLRSPRLAKKVLVNTYSFDSFGKITAHLAPSQCAKSWAPALPIVGKLWRSGPQSKRNFLIRFQKSKTHSNVSKVRDVRMGHPLLDYLQSRSR